MEVFAEYLARIDHPLHRARTEEVLGWVTKRFPNLAPKIAWNQPMFTDHGTFIIDFSVARNHLAVAPEKAGIQRFLGEIAQAGYDYTKELVRIPWDSPVDFSLLEKIIEYNILDNAECSTFWRKSKIGWIAHGDYYKPIKELEESPIPRKALVKIVHYGNMNTIKTHEINHLCRLG